MRKVWKIECLVVLMATILIGICSASFGFGEETISLVLRNGLLIDGSGAEPLPNAVIVIQQDRIVAVGAADTITIPTGAKIIDVNGAAILPGFINAHVHQGYDAGNLKAWAQGGVTTVRDLGAFTMDGQWFVRRDEFRQDPQNARLVAAGPFITVPNGYPIVPWGGNGMTITSPEEAAPKTEELLQSGADVIKTTLETGGIFGQKIPAPSIEEVTTMVNVAHQHGTVVSAHILHTSDLEPLLAAGVDDIAHMVANYLPEDLIAKVIAQGTYWVPTLELWDGVGHGFGPVAVDNLRRFVQAGGASKIALGTDYAGYSSQFDLGMPIREIQWMQEAGMTPMQIIVAATKQAAHVCNLEKESGTLEVGKIADVLVVNGNPLDDVQALLNVKVVIHQGQIIKEM